VLKGLVPCRGQLLYSSKHLPLCQYFFIIFLVIPVQSYVKPGWERNKPPERLFCSEIYPRNEAFFTVTPILIEWLKLIFSGFSEKPLKNAKTDSKRICLNFI
ncbi:hypothetical protein, partial [Streptococcus criceti]